MFDELKELWNQRLDSMKFSLPRMWVVKPNPTEWLDVIVDGRMVEINGKGEIREKHTYFIDGGKNNA